MNNSEFDKVDWINIFIFKIFQDYFNLKDLQALSMISKHTRLKLKPFLFKSIILFHFINQDNDIPFETCNIRSFQKLSSITVRDEDEIENNLYIQNSLSDICSELQDIKKFVNSASIYNAERSGRYLYSIISNFSNLSVLKIHCSTIQYSIFQKLGEHFPMLKTFELCKVVLSKYSTGNDSLNEIVFPFNLNNLIIWCVEETEISISDEPYSNVFNDIYYDGRSDYVLPNICIPSLKSLEFLRCAAENNGLEDFLDTNHNLTQLHTDTFTPGMSKHLNSLKILELAQVDMFKNLQNLTVYHNIKELNICFQYYDNYENLDKLCLMCPTIEFLQLIIRNIDKYQEDFDNFLVPILKKLPNLKTLELLLTVFDNEFELIDINHFPQIEKIIILTDKLPYLNIDFEENCNLKEVEFTGFLYDIDKEAFLNDYESYTEWEFKFSGHKVKGYRIL